MQRTFYAPSGSPNTTECFQIGETKKGEPVYNRVQQLKDQPYEQHQADYFINCLQRVEEGTMMYHTFSTFQEIIEDYNQLLKKRIPVQLEAHKHVKKEFPTKTPAFVIPKLYKFEDGRMMTTEEQEYFISLCDEDKPLTKYLNKKGYIFCTNAYVLVGEPVFMLSCILGKKTV